jgi:hypothetical protein
MLIFPPLEPENNDQVSRTIQESDCYEHAFYADQLPIEEADYVSLEYGKYTYEDIKRMVEEKYGH